MAHADHDIIAHDLDREAWWRFLIAQSAFDEAALERAQALAAETGDGVEGVLVNLGLITEQILARHYAAYLGVEYVQIETQALTQSLPDELSARFLRHARIVPLKETVESIHIAMADPLDNFAARAMVFAFERDVEVSVAMRTDIENALMRLYPDELLDLEDEALGEDSELFDDDVGRLRDLASEAPVIRFVNGLIEQALDLRASDIHIEPTETRLRIRFRVDGVLRDAEAPPRGSAAAVISRVKIMANLDIAERRLPQDGRIRIVVKGHAIDIRVSTSPTAYGESLVLRILDRDALTLDLVALGYEGSALASLEGMLSKPHGIILITGPTGSGKTTTLYAALQRLNSADRKILTIEDPIEYVLEGINQAQVKPEIGYNFAAALRSFLRQDPDVIMVGEIRDLETAQVASQAALTGHVILSTLHTNDAPSAVTRLIDMGVEPFLLPATVLGVVAQRLVRLLCPHCRDAYTPPREVIEKYGLRQLGTGGSPTLYHAKGCKQCEGTGFKGRTAIVEVMQMSEALARVISDGGAIGKLRAQAQSDGLIPMMKDGLRKALQGATTLEEVLRATQDV